MTNLEIKINSVLIDINHILDNLSILEAEKLNGKIKNLLNRIQELRKGYSSVDEPVEINQLDEMIDSIRSILNQY
jgi:predicted RNA-binding protein with EMAP domain